MTCVSTVHPFVSFWKNPQYLERVVPIHSTGSDTFSVIIPVIVYRVFEGVIDACCCLPHHIDILHVSGEGYFIQDVQPRSMATPENTTHDQESSPFSFSKKVSSTFLCILLKISPGQAFRRVGVQEDRRV